MQFEQLSCFDQVPQIRYPTLDNDGKVYCKVDWLTVMFFDSTLNDVLRWLHHENCVTDFCASLYEQSRGYDQVFKFSYNGILLETSSFNFYGQDRDISMFDTVVPKIRLELSGSALDYLRSMGIDMNEYRLVEPVLSEGGSYHFTRCDWAYDFINYKPEFLDKLIDHINTHKLPSERVPLASTKGAISCKLVTCGQKTVYLGSPQSDRMLRIYDKRMQHLDLATQTYKKANPYGDPDSWFRIEWQTRNKFANSLVHGVDENGEPADFKSILKEIFIRYAFADGTVNNNHCTRPCVDFWNELFNWSELEQRIVQNAKYVQYDSPEVRLIRDVRARMMRSMILYISSVGLDGFVRDANDYLNSLYLPNIVSVRRLHAFLSRLNEMSYSGQLSVVPAGNGLFNNCGRLAFSLGVQNVN